MALSEVSRPTEGQCRCSGFLQKGYALLVSSADMISDQIVRPDYHIC